MPTPPSATKVVTNKAQFDAAVKNTAIKTIKLGANFTGNVTADRVVNVDLGGHTLTGNLEFNTTQSGTITLSNGIVTGTLTIDTVNASFVNDGATVQGTTTIVNVAPGTFTNKGTLGAITITDTDGTRFVNNGTTGVIDVASTGNVTLEGTFDNTIKVTGAATITVPAATVINTPLAIQTNSTIISSVQVPAVIDTGVQVTVKETKEDATGTVVTGTGAEVDIKEEVAKKEAAPVQTLISELPADRDVLENGEKILQTKKAYDALSADAKTIVTDVELAKLNKSVSDFKSFLTGDISGLQRKIASAATIDEKQALVDKAYADLEVAKELGMKENEYNYYKMFVDNGQKAVDMAKDEIAKELAALTTFLTTAKNYSGYADTPEQGNYKVLSKLTVQDKTVNIDISNDAEAIAKIQAKPGVEADTAAGLYVMNTFARYVGALNYADNGVLVKEVKYNGTSYTWQAKSDGGYLKGSNWRDASGTTLVSVVTAENQEGISNVTITLVTKNGNSIDVNFTVTPL